MAAMRLMVQNRRITWEGRRPRRQTGRYAASADRHNPPRHTDFRCGLSLGDGNPAAPRGADAADAPDANEAAAPPSGGTTAS